MLYLFILFREANAFGIPMMLLEEEMKNKELRKKKNGTR